MNGRRSSLPSRAPAANATLTDSAKTVAWGLVFWSAVQLAETVFGRNAFGMVAVQATLAEWGAGRMSVAWSDPLAPMPSWAAVRRRVGRGLLFGSTAAAAVVLVALATHGATATGVSPQFGLLVMGLLVSTLASVRDELLLRGVVLRAMRGVLPPWAALLVCGAAAAAAYFGVERAVGLGLAVEGLRGIALGALWMKDRGAWMACAANGAWAFVLDAVVRGGLIDARFADSPTEGVPALVVAALAAVAAAVWALRSGPFPARP